ADARDGMRRLAVLAAALGVVAAAFLYVHETEPGWWVRLWYPLRYEAIVRGHAQNYRLDPALLAAVIYQESKFQADVESRSGAIGLMQLLPDTAKGIAIHTGGTRSRVPDPHRPHINARYGPRSLRHLLHQ